MKSIAPRATQVFLESVELAPPAWGFFLAFRKCSSVERMARFSLIVTALLVAAFLAVLLVGFR
jgi:hypothetical protein